MYIDMKGFSVKYKSAIYKCISLTPYILDEVIIGDLRYKNVNALKVYVIDDHGQFEILDDLAWEFTFL